MSHRRKQRLDLRMVYDRLHDHHGGQAWWPAETAFEVLVGAVLTQNTAWTNVERAIANLRAHGVLDAEAIVAAPHEALAEWIRPSGYFNVKAGRLKALCTWYLEHGGFERLDQWETGALRESLLAVKGIGPESADDIVLYAFHRPVFVIDAYTRRIFGRLGLVDPAAGYETLRRRFETELGRGVENVPLFNEYHALIVEHAKNHCRKRPQCDGCCLVDGCPGEGL